MFARRGNSRLVDLHDGPNKNKLPVRPEVGESGSKFDIEALIEHAEEPDPRPLYACLIGWIRKAGTSRLREMLFIDAARKQMNIGMPKALCFIERAPASEDEIGQGEQSALASSQLRRRALEGTQLVHAIVNAKIRLAVD